MSTLSSLYSHQTSGEAAADERSSTSLVAVVQQQLAVLEALATEGQAEAAALQTEVADLSARLSAVIARVAKLETTMSNHARVLSAVRAGLQEATSRAVAESSAAMPRQGNGLHEAHEARMQQPRPAASQEASTTSVRAQTSEAPVPAQPAAEANVAPVRSIASQPTPAPRPVSSEPIRTATPEPVASTPSPTPAASQPTPVQATAAEVQQPPATPAASSTPARPAPVASPQPAPAPDINDGRPRVQRGSTVEVAFEDESTEVYTIVRPNEANLSKNLIGENTPLGMALIGACVGDKRSYRVRATSPEQVVWVRSIA